MGSTVVDVIGGLLIVLSIIVIAVLIEKRYGS